MLSRTHLQDTIRALSKALKEPVVRKPRISKLHLKEKLGRVTAGPVRSLTIAAALLCWVAPLGTLAQQAAATAQKPITIQYGLIAQHYATSWSDPSLPAGVTRGTPPPPHDSVPANDTIRNTEVLGTNPARGPDDTSRPDDPAVLYAVDLGSDGMEMILSAKSTLRPGTCIAVERSGTYTNLRSVNIGYCDATNAVTVAGLASVNEAAAQRCMTARRSEADEATDANLPLQPSEIAILCDGG